MLFRILKRDLVRNISMNIIIFLFVVMGTTFIASSVNNVVTTSGAIDYFLEKTEANDYYFMGVYRSGVDKWLADNDVVTDFEEYEGVMMGYDKIYFPNKDEEFIDLAELNKLPKKYNHVLDKDDRILEKVDSGKVAISYYLASKLDLKLGDKIEFDYSDQISKELEVGYIVKDALFGSAFMNMNRLLVSDEDYDYFRGSEDAFISYWYGMNVTDEKALIRSINQESLGFGFLGDRDMVKMIYTMDMMVAGILTIVSVMLIIVALVMLRFSVNFTVQEDYREIGVMKAIGIGNKGIKSLYVFKYMFLALTGAVIGLGLSIPFGNLMLDQIKNSVAMQDASGSIVVNIACSVLVFLVVLAFSYLSARKIDKFSIIEAIRGGSSTEKIGKKKSFLLRKRKKLSVPVYLAINDIMTNKKTFITLVVVFIFGIMAVILPLNATNTLKSDEITNYFGMRKSDVYIDNLKIDGYVFRKDYDQMMTDVVELENLYRENGIDMKLFVDCMYSFKVYKENVDEAYTILSSQSPHLDASEYNVYIDGTAPKKADEIAMTEVSMRALEVGVGDKVYFRIGEGAKEFVITASFQSMNNMGQAIRFAKDAEVDFEYIDGVGSIQGDFVNRGDIEGQVEKLKKITPDYTMKVTKDLVDNTLGGITATMDGLVLVILVVVITINCLIAVLLTRTLLNKDIGTIALLKSLGFGNGTIRVWQSLRVIIVLVVAIILGVGTSFLVNPLMVKFTFGLVGADSVKQVINWWQIGLLYPAVVILGTSLAAALSTRSVGKVSFKEINSIE